MLEVTERQTSPAPQPDKLSIQAWMSRNGSLVVATASLFVAILSLWYTVNAHRSDQYYREIAIQPSVGLHYVTSTYSISFENKGLGPAKIDRIIIQFGECVDSKALPSADWDNARHRAAIALHQDLSLKVFTEAVWRTNRLRAPDFRAEIPDSGEMVMPGRELALIRMIPEQVASFDEEMIKVDWELKWKTKARFLDWARTAPIAVRFCSATGKFCRMVHSSFAELKGCPSPSDG